VANSGQRCRWLCAGGADGGLLSAVLYRALDMESADMKTNFEMAKEAGLRDSVNLERFAALVRADEREACAKACDERAQKKDLSNHRRCDADLLASAIRARGQA
jgi:hypothetical protein